MTLQPTPEDIVGSWSVPETAGVELGCYFYPDGVFILQARRQKRFAMRGEWRIEEGGRLVISDVLDPSEAHSDAERELIRCERHHIAIKKITRDAMEWQPEEAGETVALRREGTLPSREDNVFWLRLFQG